MPKFNVKSADKDPINAIKASLAKKSGLCAYLQNELSSRDAFVLKKLNDDDKVTFIFSTHNEDVMAYAKRIIHLKDGRIISEEDKQ